MGLSQTKQSYTKSSKYYDLIYLTKSKEMYENTISDFSQMCNDILEKPVENIIDLGCGTGNHAIRLKDEGINVLGIDSSDEQLKIARQNRKIEVSILISSMQICQTFQINILKKMHMMQVLPSFQGSVTF